MRLTTMRNSLIALLAAASFAIGGARALWAGTPLRRDPGYRVIVSARSAINDSVPFPDPSKDWEVRYKFLVPPLPQSPGWDPPSQVFYIWGDVAFDRYDVNGRYPLSDYLENQIVPQLMIGNSLATSDARYNPGGIVFEDWVIEAQYFWKKKGARFAQAGKIVHVRPGEEVTTVIRYDARKGEIGVGISAPSGESRITIPRPYPNEQPPLFSSWREFFERAAAKSHGLLVRPLMNVETHHVDRQTLCSVLPFSVGLMSVPGVGSSKKKYAVTQERRFSCPGPLATLSF